MCVCVLQTIRYNSKNTLFYINLDKNDIVNGCDRLSLKSMSFKCWKIIWNFHGNFHGFSIRVYTSCMSREKYQCNKGSIRGNF